MKRSFPICWGSLLPMSPTDTGSSWQISNHSGNLNNFILKITLHPFKIPGFQQSNMFPSTGISLIWVWECKNDKYTHWFCDLNPKPRCKKKWASLFLCLFFCKCAEDRCRNYRMADIERHLHYTLFQQLLCFRKAEMTQSLLFCIYWETNRSKEKKIQ